MGLLLVGIPILVIALVAFAIYMKSKHAQGEVTAGETPDETQPPANREKTWDPKERYEDGEPPAAH